MLNACEHCIASTCCTTWLHHQTACLSIRSDITTGGVLYHSLVSVYHSPSAGMQHICMLRWQLFRLTRTQTSDASLPHTSACCHHCLAGSAACSI